MSGRIKIGDKVNTPDGVGICVKMEKYSDFNFNRYGVKLDINKYSFPIAFYFAKEVQKL